MPIEKQTLLQNPFLHANIGMDVVRVFWDPICREYFLVHCSGIDTVMSPFSGNAMKTAAHILGIVKSNLNAPTHIDVWYPSTFPQNRKQKIRDSTNGIGNVVTMKALTRLLALLPPS